MPFRYPVALELEGRRCVVVGGGPVAEHKATSLREAGATVAVVASRFTGGLLELGRRGEVELVEKPYSYGDLEDAFLAIAATDDPALNADIFKEGEERRVLVNAVDDVEHCHFAVPSIVRRGDLTVAISTGGRAPALAKRLRSTLGAQLPTELGPVLDLLGDVREETLAARDVDFPTWARRWEQALDHDLVGLVREGREAEARELVRRRLEGTDEAPPGPRAGRVAIVGAGPGDPSLLTVRGRALLDAADVVVHDRLVDPSLVEGRPALSVGKEAGCHPVPQAEINALLVDLARRGHDVVRLKGGDPFLFGRGAEEAEALVDAGIEFEVVPGPTSAVAALGAAGIPVTDRRLSSSVAVVTGHCAQARVVDWERLATAVDTVVVLMGLANLEPIAAALVRGGRDPRTPAAVVERGATPEQRVVTTELGELAAAAREAAVRSPAVVVVGEVVRLRQRLTPPPVAPPLAQSRKS